MTWVGGGAVFCYISCIHTYALKGFSKNGLTNAVRKHTYESYLVLLFDCDQSCVETIRCSPCQNI